MKKDQDQEDQDLSKSKGRAYSVTGLFHNKNTL